jgi:hypothetical protein
VVNIIEANNPVDEITLSNFEHEWKTKLPEDYRTFLKTYNGGHPKPDCFNFDGEKTGSCINWFLGINNEEDDLAEYLKIYRRRIPKGFFPIADDPGGNLICIGTESKYFGKIYFWDHELETETPDFSNVKLISHTFNDFLNNLFELSE